MSFADFDLDLTELGGPITWDGSDVPDACLTPWKHCHPLVKLPWLNTTIFGGLDVFLVVKFVILNWNVIPVNPTKYLQITLVGYTSVTRLINRVRRSMSFLQVVELERT